MRFLLFFLAGVAGIGIFMLIAVRSPVSQTIFGKIVSGYLSRKSGTPVMIRKISISSHKRIKLTGITILDACHDTVFSCDEVTARFNKIRLKSREIGLQKFHMQNTALFMVRKRGEEKFNYEGLEQLFPEDTSTAPSPPWRIKVDEINCSGIRFVYNDENRMDSITDGIDFNNLRIFDLVLQAKNLEIDQDTVSLQLDRFRASEQSGFSIFELKGDLTFTPAFLAADSLNLVSNRSALDLDFILRYKDYADLASFTDSVNILADFRPSQLNLADIGFFAPDMKVMDQPIRFSGAVIGKVNSLKARDFEFNTGEDTRFIGNIHLFGLPDIFNTFADLEIVAFETSVADISRFPIPTGPQYLSIPPQAAKLGKITVQGDFSGFYNDFISKADFYSEMGHISTDIVLNYNETYHDLQYKGQFSAENLNLGELLDLRGKLGKLNIRAELTGHGTHPDRAVASVIAFADSVDFNGNNYNNVVLSGDWVRKKFSGDLFIEDENLDMDFQGMLDFSKPVPDYNFTARIDHARLYNLNLSQRDSLMEVSMKTDINFSGSKLDEMQGTVKIDSLRYSESGTELFMEKLNLSMTRDSVNQRIRLFSDFLDATVEGSFLFRDLYPAFARTINIYLDRMVPDSVFGSRMPASQDLWFDIDLKNTAPLSSIFVPGLAIGRSASVKGAYHTNENAFSLHLVCPELTLSEKKITGIEAGLEIGGDSIRMVMTGKEFRLTDTVAVRNLKVNAGVRYDTVGFQIAWADEPGTTFRNGFFDGQFYFSDQSSFTFGFREAGIVINENPWKMKGKNLISLDTGAYHFRNVNFSSEGQQIYINGNVSHNETDTLNITLDNFDLSNFDPVVHNYSMDMDGRISGGVKLTNLFKVPTFLNDLQVAGFAFNGEKLGDLTFRTAWNNRKKSLDLNTEITYTGNAGQSRIFEAFGSFYPTRTDTSFNIGIILRNYKLNTLKPFVSSFSSKIGGMASGNLHLLGTLDKPVIRGDIGVNRGSLKVDYLNVEYNFADRIWFDENRIWFKDWVIFDSLNNQAKGTGTVAHKYFRDFHFDLQFSPASMAALNTTRNPEEMFYGKALASGDVRIHGPLTGLVIDINASPEKGTQIVIPVDMSVSLSQNDYILFKEPVERTNGKDKTRAEVEEEYSGVVLNMNFMMNPHAEVEIALPYQMGRIKASGKGDITMAVNEKGDLAMNGDYIIAKGSLFFTLQNIINRYFDIESGGKVSFTGDPYDAEINMKAIYRLKTTLGNYVPEKDSATRVPVNCIISLRKNLFDPEMRFTIEFPDLDDELRQYVYARIDTSDQVLMSQQMISLLVLNSFIQGTRSGSAVGFNSFSVISNQLNNWLSQISKDFDIGINYRPGDVLSEHEVELALSTQLLNERITIDANVGVKGEQGNTYAQAQTSNIVGEVQVEFKISPDGRFRVKAFNKSNNNYLIRNYAPYTQGVGVFYTQEFNTLRELFSNKKKQKRKE